MGRTDVLQLREKLILVTAQGRGRSSPLAALPSQGSPIAPSIGKMPVSSVRYGLVC